MSENKDRVIDHIERSTVYRWILFAATIITILGVGIVQVVGKFWEPSLKAPTGYSIYLGANQAKINEIFTVYVEPKGKETIDSVVLVIKSPSGEYDTERALGKGRFQIYAEPGVWRIGAIVRNEAGSYEARNEDDYASILIMQ